MLSFQQLLERSHARLLSNIKVILFDCDGVIWIVAAVEVAAGKKPDCIVGKPSHVIIDLIRSRNPGVNENEMIMIGDRLDTDILFARKNGIRSLLVLIGVTSEEELMESNEEMMPDYYTDSIRDVATIFGFEI